MRKTLKTRLRIRFVVLAMLSLLLIQSGIVGVSIYNNYRDLVTKSDMLISQLHNNPSGASRYFSVKIPAGRDTVFPDVVQHVSITVEEATAFAREALSQDREKGFLGSYRYRIYQNESGTKICFLFRESGIDMCKAAAENMIWVSLIGLFVIGAVLIPVSGWVVKPIVDNHNRQKQFITSASHELKTPLTVISTNAQLLQSEIGENEWLDGIEKQVAYLTKMTHDLVTLSKAEEYDNPLMKENFSFSEVLNDGVETYRALAKQKDIQIFCGIQEDLTYLGSKEEVQQLLRILLDNACKYCPEKGNIHISAKRTFHGVRLSVTNTAENLSDGDAKSLLLRFQRGTNSAGATGFGLGLSIAEAIVNRHNGHLTVSAATQGAFRVEVVLP